MGWYSNRSRSVKECVEFIKSEHPFIIDYRVCHFTNMWAVVHVPDLEHPLIVLYLIRKCSDGEYSYKDVSEDMGPFELDCPEDIFKQAAPEGINESSRAWRQARAEYFAQRQAKSKLKKSLALGDNVNLVNGKTYNVVNLKPLLGKSLEDGIVYRLTKKLLKA